MIPEQTVQTASGPVDLEALGQTLMHEHVIVLRPRAVLDQWPDLWDRNAAVQTVIADMAVLKNAGIDALVDMTTVDLGRHAAVVASIAERSAVKIIVCTGLWLEPPPLLRGVGAARLAESFIKDIEEGIEGTQVRAGVIKVATDTEVDDMNRMIIAAAAVAHKRTGVPIVTHSNAQAKSGAAQQDALEEEGVDLRRVVIGHCSDTTDLDYLRGLMQRGSTIGMDRFGLDRLLSSGEELLNSDQRVDIIAQLCRDGFAKQIVLGHDATCYNPSTDRKALRAELPNWHHLHIPLDVVAKLRTAGVPQADIDSVLTGNPRSLFANSAPY